MLTALLDALQAPMAQRNELQMQAVMQSFTPGINVLKATLAPGGLRNAIVNFDEIAAHLWHRLEDELLAAPQLRELIAEVEPWFPPAAKRVSNASTPSLAQQRAQPVLSTRFTSAHGELAFFSMFTTVGAPQDITAASLRVEHFFAADEKTHAVMTAEVAPA